MTTTRLPIHVLALAALALLLAACAATPPAMPSAQPPAGTATPGAVVAVQTAVPPTVAQAPTRTPAPTPTATPTVTMTPTAVPTPLHRAGTPLPPLVPITAANAGRLALLARYAGGYPLFSPDGTLLATVSGDAESGCTVRLYRVSDGSLVFEVEAWGAVFSPDGTLLATDYYTDIVRLYRVSDGSLVFEGGRGHPVFSPDGRLLATRDYDTDTVRLYRVSEGSLVLEAEGYHDPVFSPDSTLLVMTSVYPDYLVRLYRVSDGSLVLEAVAAGWPGVFSPDSTLLATGAYDDFLRLYRVSDGSLVYEHEGEGFPAFSPDGTLLTAMSGDSPPASMRLYRVSDGRLVGEFASVGFPFVFSPDGTLLATVVGYTGVRLYRVSDSALLDEFAVDFSESTESCYLTELVFSPDGTRLTFTFDCSDEEEFRGYAAGRAATLRPAPDMASIRVGLPIPSRLAIGGRATWPSRNDLPPQCMPACLWRLSDGKPLIENMWSPVFSPDGTLLATSWTSGEYPNYVHTVRLYRASDGSLAFEVEAEAREYAFSPDGTLLAIAADAGIELWGIAP